PNGSCSFTNRIPRSRSEGSLCLRYNSQCSFTRRENGDNHLCEHWSGAFLQPLFGFELLLKKLRNYYNARIEQTYATLHGCHLDRFYQWGYELKRLMTCRPHGRA